MNSVHSQSRERDSGSFSNQSAFETDLALAEAKRWIEEVTEEKFRSSRFKASLQDGILLCKLVNRLKPGVVRKINTIPTTMCYMENVSFFLNACKELGLKGSQLFDVSDLQDVPRRKEAKGGSIRGDYERTLRNVCITIYWLGRAANRISGYEGPQLDEKKFMELIGPHSLAGEENKPIGGFHALERSDYDDATLGRESLAIALKKDPGALSENGGHAVRRANDHAEANRPESATAEKERPATVEREEVLRSKPSSGDASKRASDVFRDIAISVDMRPGENRFGFSVVGGKDEGFQVKVDSVQSGLPAERAGLRRGDLVLWVNGQTVLNADHRQVVSLITECVVQKSITLGVRRTMLRSGSLTDDSDVKTTAPATDSVSSDRGDGTPTAPVASPRKPEAVKKRYKTSRALEVHFQTKKRTRTEVTCHEEEEEVPASLQSGRSRRIVYVTRAELVRHFETSTKPKKEIAWLIIYTGGLFAPVPVQVTSRTVRVQRERVSEVVRSGGSGAVAAGTTAETVTVRRAARPSSQVLDHTAPVIVDQTEPVVVTDVVERKEVPLESFVLDDKKRKRRTSSEVSDNNDERTKRDGREGSSSSSSSSSSDDANVPLAKKATSNGDVAPMDVDDGDGDGDGESEEVISATRHGKVKVDWGVDEAMDRDGDDDNDRSESIGRDSDDDNVVVRGMRIAAPLREADFDTRGMAPVDETQDSVMLESVVESAPDWGELERLGDDDDDDQAAAAAPEAAEATTTTTTTTVSQPIRRHREFISESEFEEVNTTIVNVHERSSLRLHWQTRRVPAAGGNVIVVEQKAQPIPAPRATAVLVRNVAVAEPAELTRSEPRTRLEGDESWVSEGGVGDSFAVSGDGESEEIETAAPSLKFQTQLDEAVPAVATVMSPVSHKLVDVSEKPSPKPRIKLTGDNEWGDDEGESSFAVTGEADTDEYEVEGRRQRAPVATVTTVTTVESVPLRQLDELKATEDEKQRYSLTEEEKLRTKREIENIWAQAENRDERSNSPSPEKKEVTEAAVVVEADVVESVNDASSPVVRPARQISSSAWDDESSVEGGKFKRYEGVEPLLASLAHIKSKYNAEEPGEFDISFLEEYIARPEFSSAMKVHNRVIEVSSENGPKPVVSRARSLLDDTRATAEKGKTTEADELAALLMNPHFQGVCYAHDRIADRDFAPPTPVLEGLVEKAPLPIDERAPGLDLIEPVKSAPDIEVASPVDMKEPMRIVRIPRTGNDPIGVTVRTDDDKVFVSRIMKNSKADKLGELREGDEILQINRKPVQGKSIDDVAGLMRAAPGPVDLALKPTGFNDSPPDQTEIFVKANFSYDPTNDPYIPCDELGLAFKTGDILHIYNQSDAFWWQATLADDVTREFAGLVPGREQHERKQAMTPKVRPDDDDDEFGRPNRKKKKKGSCVPKKSKKRRHLYRPGDSVVGYGNDEDDVPPYEQVIKVNPDPRHRRPIVFIGPDGIGTRSVIQHLISLDEQKFASVLPETSRPMRLDERDGDLYRFVTKDQMERDYKSNSYVEYGELNGNYYGTRTESIRSIVESGRVCLLSLHQKALKLMKQSDLKPYTIFVRPGDHGPTPVTNGHSAANGTDETLKRQQNEARYIDAHFGHYVDQTIVLSDVGSAAKEVLRAVDRLASQPQWMYASWDHRR
uniref:MPP5 n=1 Tax=Oscarella lobularis TaxID=121494 RepID=A0A2P1GIZ5_OSCLO|nr:MPP5 [Oscarella lobularis]